MKRWRLKKDWETPWGLVKAQELEYMGGDLYRTKEGGWTFAKNVVENTQWFEEIKSYNYTVWYDTLGVTHINGGMCLIDAQIRVEKLFSEGVTSVTITKS